jgi:uncharacterized protein
VRIGSAEKSAENFPTMKKAWWQDGVKFECQGSGRCCVSRGEYGHVYLTLEDRQLLARHFKLSTRAFTTRYCEKELGYWKLKDFTEACAFLEDNRCSVYLARPTQCRTWPFWPENMSPKAWKKALVGFCPGVGKGKVRTEAEIRAQLEEQKRSEERL